MIHQLKPTIVLPESRLAGFFSLIARRPDGSSRHLATFDAAPPRVVGPFGNLITDGGLERLGVGSFRDICVVGSGATAPANSDVTLQTTIARTGNAAPNVPGASNSGAPNYYTQTNTGFRFSAGTAAGNISEVGLGWSTGAGLTQYQLFCRALVKDGGGVPTTVTVLGDEVLDVYYSLRNYPPLTDVTYSVTISGTTYACVTRAAGVTNTSSWSVPNSRVVFSGKGYGSVLTLYNGDIGGITSQPSGVTSPGNSIVAAAYSSNSKQQDGTATIGLNEGNLAGGIKSLLFATDLGAYQTSFTPPIPKDNTKVLTLSFRFGWARR